MGQTLDFYKSLPYSRRAEGIREGEGRPYWVAWIEELPGCKTDGATYAEAMLNLDSAFDDYIEAMLEFESEIPLPTKVNTEVAEITVGGLQQELSIEFSASDDNTGEPASPKSLRVQASEKEPWVQDEAVTTTGAVASAI